MSMRSLLRRAGSSLLTLFALLTLVFLISHLIGDPARLMLETGAPEELYQELRQKLGLNDPLPIQFGRAIGGWLRGDFGASIWQHVPALPLALGRLPNTLLLLTLGLTAAFFVAIVLGLVSALRPGSLIDRFLSILSLTAVSIADFWIGLILILVVSAELRWLPSSGFGGVEFVILPALTIAFRPTGRIAQVARAAMIDEMNKPYVIAARARGRSERAIVVHHVLRTSAIPIFTITSDELAGLVGGSAVMEFVFGWPGSGSLFITAIQGRDLPLIEACIFVIGTAVIVINFLVDLLYARLDPRIRNL
jgi:peptide/nickel transport system permease protein